MDNDGLVIDVERFALHDGPGIRTTVFLKGCPLNCVWCHNPESADPHPEALFRYDRCAECLRGGFDCPFGVALERDDTIHERRSTGIVDPNQCPRDSVRIVGRRRTVASVLQEVIEDGPFYKSSGGGMTISGGEPMLQYWFTRALLMTAKSAGIHTCLDTSGYAPMRHYRAVLPYVDLFLFDYKATNPEKHRRLTGVSNQLIVANLHKLIALGAQVLLRCPLVPGINDDIEHLSAIAALTKRYPRLVGYEIMPFHDLGREKWRGIGKVNPLAGLQSASETQKSEWTERLHGLVAGIICTTTGPDAQ